MANSDCKFSVNFLDVLYYSTDDVLRIISEAAFHSQSAFLPETEETPGLLCPTPGPSTECRSADEVANQQARERYWHEYLSLIKEIYVNEELRDLRSYYTDRLIKLISDGKIELWNSDITKVINLIINKNIPRSEDGEPSQPISIDFALQKLDEYNKSILDGSFATEYREKSKNTRVHSPLHQKGRYSSQYHVDPYVLNSSIIHKSDLVGFCENQKIEIIFENSSSNTLDDTQQKLLEAPLISTNNEEPRPIGAEYQDSGNNTTHFRSPDVETPQETGNIPVVIELGVPGKMPRIAMGKIVIKTAWKIEQETGQIASVHQVWDELQQCVKDLKHSHILRESLPTGIKWGTGKNYEKIYSKASCSRALNTWKKSRLSKQRKTKSA